MAYHLPYKSTKRLRDKVMRLVGSGMSERSLAEVLGIDRKTVVAHYAHELEVGRARCEAELNDLLWTAAREGSVAAMKHLEGRASGERMQAGQKILGKKEQQLEAAKVAGVGTEWEADLIPLSHEVN